MNRSHLARISLAYIAFIALGLPDGVLGVAWPSIRASFGMPLDALGVLLTAAVAGYLVASFASGVLVGWLGVGWLLAGSCALTGGSLIGYTLVPDGWMLVLLAVAAGAGAGAIDAGLNAYAASHFSERVMQWLHASYGVGVTLGPMIMTLSLSAWHSWRIGYGVVAGFQVLLAAGFMLSLPLWQPPKSPPDSNAKSLTLMDYQTPLRETLRQSRVWASALLFLLYTGAELTLGLWAYTLLTEARGLTPTTAGLVTGSYWAAFTVGRLVAGVYTQRIGSYVLVRGSLWAAGCGSVLLAWNPAQTSNVMAVVLIGLAVAPIFPALVSSTRQRVGVRFATQAIGIQMAAASLGAALIPAVVGILARRVSFEAIPLALIGLFAGLLWLHSRLGGDDD